MTRHDLIRGKTDAGADVPLPGTDDDARLLQGLFFFTQLAQGSKDCGSKHNLANEATAAQPATKLS